VAEKLNSGELVSYEELLIVKCQDIVNPILMVKNVRTSLTLIGMISLLGNLIVKNFY
jgi:hypothetical protein